MFVTVDSLITLEDTVAGTSTHEVVVTLTWGKTAAHSRPRLATTFTALGKKGCLIHLFQQIIYYNPYNLNSIETALKKKQNVGNNRIKYTIM